MFADADFIAAGVRDAARWLNESLVRARKAGLTVTVKVDEAKDDRCSA
jgi:hypothetical protein